MRRISSRTEGLEQGEGSSRRGLPFARSRWGVVGIVIGVLGSSWVGVGRGGPRASDGAAVTSNEEEGTIDGTVRKVAQGVQDVSTTVRDRVSRARASGRNQDLISQVKARLLQDKSLNAQNIDVQVDAEGVVVLKGLVPTADDKDAAVDLTRDVRGVLQVEDHLAVPPARRVFASQVNDEPSISRTYRTR